MKLKTLSGEVLFEDENETIKKTVEAAVKADADMRGADLTGVKGIPGQ